MSKKTIRGQRSVLTAFLGLVAACGFSVFAASASQVATVNSIYVESNQCLEGLRGALIERNIGVTDKVEASDAIMKVEITPQGRNLDEIPEFGGIGSKASYSASLYGSLGKVLFSTVGEEGSTTEMEMCEDIGDEIAERLLEQRNS